MYHRPPMTFDEPAETAEANRRATSRRRVKVTADYRRIGRTPFRIDVADLSQTGCRCETTSKVYLGDTVWIGIAGLAPIEAIIRWANPTGFGAEWTHPMHIAVFEHICKLHPQFG